MKFHCSKLIIVYAYSFLSTFLQDKCIVGSSTKSKGNSTLDFIFTFFYTSRRKYWFRENFRFRFSMDLHVLGCPEHDLTIFGKCLSVCQCVTKILWQV